MKDVAALEQELAALAKRKSDLEDIELAVMETNEERERALADSRGALADLDDRIAEATTARDAALGGAGRRARQADADRAAIAAKVPATICSRCTRSSAPATASARRCCRAGCRSRAASRSTRPTWRVVRAASAYDVLLCPDSNAILVRTGESGL